MCGTRFGSHCHMIYSYTNIICNRPPNTHMYPPPSPPPSTTNIYLHLPAPPPPSTTNIYLHHPPSPPSTTIYHWFQRSRPTRGGNFRQQMTPANRDHLYPDSLLYVSVGFLPRVNSQRLN